MLFLWAVLCAVHAIAQTADLAKLDKNFRTATFKNYKVEYRNALVSPFVLEGFPWWKPGDVLYRLPKDHFTKQDVKPAVLNLANQVSGGAVLFRTNSKYITIRAKLRWASNSDRMPRAGSGGFDFYLRGVKQEKYLNTLRPTHAAIVKEEPMEMLLNRNDGKMHDYILYLPLYSGVERLEIGTEPGAKFETPTPHRVKKPVLFYGSSIIQGSAASRPANNFSTMLARTLDFHQINLGFSGNGLCYPKMAELIGTLDLAAIITNIENNGSLTYLKQNYPAFLRTIRRKLPKVPIIVISFSPVTYPQKARYMEELVKQMAAAGDKNIYYVDCGKHFDYAFGTVDNCHPNDHGFYRSYEVILPVLHKILTAKH